MKACWSIDTLRCGRIADLEVVEHGNVVNPRVTAEEND